MNDFKMNYTSKWLMWNDWNWNKWLEMNVRIRDTRINKVKKFVNINEVKKYITKINNVEIYNAKINHVKIIDVRVMTSYPWCDGNYVPNQPNQSEWMNCISNKHKIPTSTCSPARSHTWRGAEYRQSVRDLWRIGSKFFLISQKNQQATCQNMNKNIMNSIELIVFELL